MSILKMDEIHKLAIPYETYFGEMEISKDEQMRRIELAYSMEIVYFYIFALIRSYKKVGKELNKAELEEILYRRLEDMLIAYGLDIDKYDLDEYLHNISDYVIDSSIVEEDDEDTENDILSRDRAKSITENEVNKIYNRVNFKDAKFKGLKKKTWVTEKDDRVRIAHALVDEITIPIDELFLVGGELMNYPCDDSASPQNIVRCRCVCKYS